MIIRTISRQHTGGAIRTKGQRGWTSNGRSLLRFCEVFSSLVVILGLHCPFALRVMLMQQPERLLRPLRRLRVRAPVSRGAHHEVEGLRHSLVVRVQFGIGEHLGT